MKYVVPRDYPFAPPTLPDRVAFGPVRLAVTRADRALYVWRDLIGLTVISNAEGLIGLGVGERILIELEIGAVASPSHATASLYHVAIHVVDRRELARVVGRLMRAGYPTSPTDHVAAEATYLSDHDGNGIEITHETPWRGYLNPDLEERGQPEFLDYDGNSRQGSSPLDYRVLLAELASPDDIDRPLGEGTRIGHIHLSVDDLGSAMHFYNNVLGLEGRMLSRTMGMGDVGTSMSNHFIAFNTWSRAKQSAGTGFAAGLRHVTLTLPRSEDVLAACRRLEDAGHATEEIPDGIATRDPFGNSLLIISGSAARKYLKGNSLPKCEARLAVREPADVLNELYRHWSIGCEASIDHRKTHIAFGNGQTLVAEIDGGEIQLCIQSPEHAQMGTLARVVDEIVQRNIAPLSSPIEWWQAT